MAPPGFFSNLPFRPQQGKRKRAGSLLRAANPPKPAHNATIEEADDEYFAEQPKSEEDPHTAKKPRFNDPGDDTPVDDSKAVANRDLASNLDDLRLRGRVIRRRKAPVSPFIPRKPRGIVKAVVRRNKPHQKPVSGQASLLSPAEQQLTLALKTKGDQVNLVDNLKGLPKVARDPAVGPQERSEKELYDAQVPVHYDANDLTHNDESVLVNGGGVPVHSDKYGTAHYDEQNTVDYEEQEEPSYADCVCGSIVDDAHVHCEGCNKLYHPAHIGKGLQDPALYLDKNRRDQAMQEDAEFYRKKGGFTCNGCDDEGLAAKERWAPKEYNAEKRRRNKLFLTKRGLGKGETAPRECDNCEQIILSTATRYECRFCVAANSYDLCLECFSDPAVSSLHQH